MEDKTLDIDVLQDISDKLSDISFGITLLDGICYLTLLVLIVYGFWKMAYKLIMRFA